MRRNPLLEDKLREKACELCEHYEEVEAIEHHIHHIGQAVRFGTVAILLAVSAGVYTVWEGRRRRRLRNLVDGWDEQGAYWSDGKEGQRWGRAGRPGPH